MSEELNLLEKATLDEIASFNFKKYPFIKKHIPYLRVKSRKTTGVGIYVTFEYLIKYESLANLIKEDIFLSSKKSLKLDNLKYELNYELNITRGKIDFLEFVTNDESWNGSYKFFKWI